MNRKRRTNGVLFWDSTNINPDTKIHGIKRVKPIKRPIEHVPEQNLIVEQEFKLIARKGRPELPKYNGICHLCQSNKVLIRIGKRPDGDFKTPKTKAKTLGRIYQYLDYDMKEKIGQQLGMVSDKISIIKVYPKYDFISSLGLLICRNGVDIMVHQLCVDYVPKLYQNTNPRKGVLTIDSYPVEKIKKLKGTTCFYCKGNRAHNSCANKKCKRM